MGYSLCMGAAIRTLARDGPLELDTVLGTLLWPLVMLYAAVSAVVSSQRSEDPRELVDFTLVMSWNVLLVVIFAAAFFFWNHLQNVFGPTTG